MKASEIVSKLKEVLLSSEEVEETVDVTEVELQETPVVAEEVTAEAETKVAQELAEEAPVEAEDMPEAPSEELGYATKEELAEVKAMVESLMEKLQAKQEVPEELSSQEPEVEGLTHTPENASEKRNMHLFSQNKPMTTLDRVMQRISNK